LQIFFRLSPDPYRLWPSTVECLNPYLELLPFGRAGGECFPYGFQYCRSSPEDWLQAYFAGFGEAGGITSPPVGPAGTFSPPPGYPPSVHHPSLRPPTALLGYREERPFPVPFSSNLSSGLAAKDFVTLAVNFLSHPRKGNTHFSPSNPLPTPPNGPLSHLQPLALAPPLFDVTDAPSPTLRGYSSPPPSLPPPFFNIGIGKCPGDEQGAAHRSFWTLWPLLEQRGSTGPFVNRF